jgi:hypothetical protein
VPTIVVLHPYRMTPPERSWVIHVELGPEGWTVRYRYGKLRAERVTVLGMATTTATGLRVKGHLWLMGDGVYEVRSEAWRGNRG